ncbi:hypothetical protein [Lactococcus lactis]|uniref:Uncharacterized protein n=1 Tax=Lactococcus lactis TaxID=1358 RepID=A0AAP3Z1Y9_9LACT|nr:hypothetical protein [Lactococcus lactis]MDG4976885.1 hypothetical protein [Lactococcus lactis]
MIVVPSVKNLLTEHILALMDMLVFSSEDSRALRLFVIRFSG